MLKVIIAEDDLFIADMLEDVLIGGGYEVCGIARTVDEAVELGERHKPDLAILDMRLADGGLGVAIPARLNRAGELGVLYATGNIGQVELTKTDGHACLRKPYAPADVLRALKIVEQIVNTGEASQPFPHGFEVIERAPLRVTAPFSRDRGTPEGTKRLLRQQAALAGFGSFAFGESDIGKVLTEAARLCADGLDVPFCKVCRYRPEENDLLVEAGVGWHQGVIGCVVSRADETSPQGRAFITGEPVICTDLNKDAIFVLPPFYAEHGIVSTLDVVITAEGQPYGVLEIDSPVRQTYDQHDIDFLTGFANVLAGAVNTHNRNAVLQGTVRRMKDMVADRDQLLAAKNLVLQEKSQLLEEKNRLLAEKNVLALELQHRVRNNLQLVSGMLHKQLQTSTDPVGEAGVGAIARRVMTLAEVYDHLLGAELGRTIKFGGYLKSLCGSLTNMEGANLPDIQLTCQADEIDLDLDSVTVLGLVVAELVANSYAHAFPDGKGTIKVALLRRPSDEAATITIADDGPGFVETGESKRRGLGLVKRLMSQVNGSVALNSDQGAVWTLSFPVAAAPVPGETVSPNVAAR
jgi:two-component sensor histidine kinase/CheY-like chemotaxis protein/putative methionine-R-sulfoxide reductase with GAF domain